MYILGIYDGHNATASLLKDGKIVACASEERFKRKKNWIGYPEESVNYCLNSQHISPNDLECVVLAANHISLLWNLIKRETVFSIQDYVNEQDHYFKRILIDGEPEEEVAQSYFAELTMKFGNDFEYDISNLPRPLLNSTKWLHLRKKRIFDHLNIDNIFVIDHHSCHKNYAIYASPFRQKTLVLTLDAWGDDGTNATVSVYENNVIKEVKRTSTSNIARLYRYVTLLLGMKPNEHEYKVMGLAPYASYENSNKIYEMFEDVFCVNGLEFAFKKKPKDIYFYFQEKFRGYRFEAIAGGLQKFTEKLVTDWVRNAISETGVHDVVFSGGVAMNVKLNMKIAKMFEVNDLFVPPSGGDESLAIGACYAVYNKEKKPLKNIFLGPKDSIIPLGGIHVYPMDIAKLLSDGNIIARFDGRMEFGARALGNRSIICDPSNPANVIKINKAIKNRDFWMPFAPSILEERALDYICNPKNLKAPYMTIAFDSTDLAKKHFLGAMHSWDYTLRPQLVNKYDGDYYYILKAFERLTGIGGVLNTSFNLHGNPIVCSVNDAMHVFKNSDLKYILINDILYEKE